MIGLFSVTWLSLLYKFTRFFIYFLFLSDEGPMLETLDYTIRIGSTPTILFFDFCFNNGIVNMERFSPLYAIAYAIMNNMEKLRFGN